MRPPTVLIVEDNPISRKMERLALQGEGYAVLEAPDGRTALDLMAEHAPDLVLQDLLLPDMDGFDLVGRLRALPGGAEVPIIAVSGFLSRMEEARVSSSGFTDFLSKPVEPSRLIEVVEAHLPSALASPKQVAEGPGVLVVDDDPAQLKLARLRLGLAGFRVTLASDGMEALEQAGKAAPDAVLSDILMPRLDGFRLCLAIRNDPRLARVPVVLITSSYLEEADRRFAEEVGASAFVLRTPDLDEAIAAVRAALGTEPPRPQAAPALPDAVDLSGVIHRLEHQAASSARLAHRCAVQAAALSVLSGIAEALALTQDVSRVLDEVLARCVDAGGLSRGALYLVGRDGRLRLQASNGYPESARPHLEACFGQEALCRTILAKGAPVALPSPAMPEPAARGLLEAAETESAVLVPILSHGERLGILFLSAKARDLEEEDWLAFARTVAAQVGQGVALTRAFARVATSEMRYRSLFERNLAGVYRTSLEGRILECNDAFARIFGHASREEVRKLGASVLYPHPAEREAFVARLQAEGALINYESEGRRKDGAMVWTLENASLVQDRGNGVPCIEGTIVDVTERKRLERQLRQAQKMEAIGQLAGGVAHDFNNLLGVIGGHTDLALKRLGVEDPLRRHLDEIRKAGDRAAGLTRQLLAFSRKQIVEPTVLDLDEVVRGLEGMLGRLIREDIQLATVLGAEPVLVSADRGQVEQVVMNLVVNARDAMPEGGRLTIETARAELDEAYCREHEGARPGPHVMLAVSDTGIGMDAETRSHIFEPFFTTKDAGKGTGLGLATVYGIVKQAGGSIWVYSEPGQGTAFKVYLPRAEEGAVVAARPAVAPTETPRGTETILLVEDEETLRTLTREVLESLGYTVLEARHGVEALELSERHEGRIDLLLTDVVMPHMSGRELAERLEASRPETRALFISGYTDDAVMRHRLVESQAAFLQKPFTADALARKVREMLDAPRAG